MYDLYHCDNTDSSRFILGKNGTKKLFVVGLNPSTANKEKSDTTVAKVEKVARSNGYDGFVMTNLYPLRSTDPKDLPQDYDKALFDENIEQIIKSASAGNNPEFWAAWGKDIILRPYLSESLKTLERAVKDIKGNWLHYGELLKNGHPRHPSRLSYEWEFYNFDTYAYLEKL